MSILIQHRNGSPAPNTASALRFGIGEPSFADAIAAIAHTSLLAPKRKTHLTTSLRQVARYLGQPVASIPARFAAIRSRILALHPAQLGVNPKTFTNHRANVRAALLFFNRQTHGSGRSAAMADSYRTLLSKLPDRHARDVLSPFFRFSTLANVLPRDVGDSDVAAYAAFRAETGFRPLKPNNVRKLVRHWNAASMTIPEWPAQRLTEPDRLTLTTGPGWEAFPEQLRADIETYLLSLARSRRAVDGRRFRPCATSTIATRRRELIATVRAAVSAGIPLDDLSSLRELLRPDRVKVIIEHYWAKNGEIPRTYTIDLAIRIVSIARNMPGFDPAEFESLVDIRQALEPHRQKGLTEKNRTVVRKILHSDVWPKVIQLPRILMAKARSGGSRQQPNALRAQLGVAIAILTVAPVRMQSLATIQLGRNLVRPGGPDTPYLLTLQEHEVKNRVPLDFPLPAWVSQLIDEYIATHRPILMNSHNHDYLFPGKSGGHKFVARLSTQISRLLWKAAGLKVTPHQFRHAAAALILNAQPGNYELVRRILGHRKIQTTIDFYIGLETDAAARQFGAMVARLDADTSQDATVR